MYREPVQLELPLWTFTTYNNPPIKFTGTIPPSLAEAAGYRPGFWNLNVWEMMGMTNTENLIAERGKTHGSFADNARISQKLKDLFDLEQKGHFTPIQLESLDMIALKLSRILSGQAGTKDHWDDIAGYATLAAKEIDSNG